MEDKLANFAGDNTIYVYCKDTQTLLEILERGRKMAII